MLDFTVFYIRISGTAHSLDFSSVTGSTCKGAIFLALLLAVLAASIIVLAVALTNCTRDQFRKSAATFPALTDDKNETRKSRSGNYRFASVAADNALCSKIGT